jgi:hypothetical protein
MEPTGATGHNRASAAVQVRLKPDTT